MAKLYRSPQEILTYWKNYYQSGGIEEPSDFAKFVLPKLKGTLVDIGCGNGRDTRYLQTENTIGIDPATVGGNAENLSKADNYYARFFFHAVTEKLEDKVLRQIHGTLYAESRAEGDDSYVDDHYRRPINPEKFISKLIKLGYRIKYVEVARGLAVYNGQDPLIIRTVAQR